MYEAPSSREVAKFIGTMNFFDANVAAVGEDTATIIADGLGEITIPVVDFSFRPGEQITAAIRPEKISVFEEQPPDQLNVVNGIIENAAYLGERSHFYVRIEGVEHAVAYLPRTKTRCTMRMVTPVLSG